MGVKRFIWSTQSKHYWHIDGCKVTRLNLLYAQIEAERRAAGKGGGSIALDKRNNNMGVLKDA